LLTEEMYETICRFYSVSAIVVSKLGESDARYLVRKRSTFITIEAPIGFRLLRVTVDTERAGNETCEECDQYGAVECWQVPTLAILFEKVS